MRIRMSGKESRNGLIHARAAGANSAAYTSSMRSRRPAFITSSTSRRTICLFASVLFGSVTSQDIVDAIQEARGITIDRRKVHLEEPIRTVGTRMIEVEVDNEL